MNLLTRSAPPLTPRNLTRSAAPANMCFAPGWSSPEDWGTWMVGQEAVLEMEIPAAAKDRSNLAARLQAIAFIPRGLNSRSFTFTVAETVIGGVTFFQFQQGPKVLPVEMNTPTSETPLVRILANEQASRRRWICRRTPARHGIDRHLRSTDRVGDGL